MAVFNFWFKQVVGENSLVEGEDYVICGAEENRQPLLTIESVQGITLKTIESRFSLTLKARDARRVLGCLQKIDQKIEENTP